jgi:hypothetical protein
MKKPGLTGLKLEHGLSLPTEWTSFSIRSGEAVRNHFKHSVERLDGDGEIADHSAAVGNFILARRLMRKEIVEDSAKR